MYETKLTPGHQMVKLPKRPMAKSKMLDWGKLLNRDAGNELDHKTNWQRSLKEYIEKGKSAIKQN